MQEIFYIAHIEDLGVLCFLDSEQRDVYKERTTTFKEESNESVAT